MVEIFIISEASPDGSAYLEEILRAQGLCFCQRSSLSTALKMANPREDVLLLPYGSATEGVEAFLQKGGDVVAIQPRKDLDTLAGLVCAGREEGRKRLRFVESVCFGSQGQSLWTHGRFSAYELSGEGAVLAYLFEEEGYAEERPGIVESRVGEGRLVVYAYDPGLCVARLRQGYPERANHLPDGQLTPRAAFLQWPDAPADTFWRPTADLHGAGLGGVIRRLIEDRQPLPILWHLPHGAASALLFSGDEDGATQDENEAEMRDIESFGGTMNLYVIPDITSITREKIASYQKRGHAISVHPNLTGAAGESPEDQLAEADRQMRSFQEKFDVPMRTLRNHSYMWPGYVELPELWERWGVGMDANVTAVLRGQSRDFGPFANLHAALPLPYVREDGSLIDVYQQPTQLNDDLICQPASPKSHKYALGEFRRMVERIFADAMQGTHSPICVNFHPSNYAKYSGDCGHALLTEAKSRGLPIWSLDRWHDFWRARASWAFEELVWEENTLRLTLKGTPTAGLTVGLPYHFCGKILSTLRVAGNVRDLEVVPRQGRELCLAKLPRDATDVEIVAEYFEKE